MALIMENPPTTVAADYLGWGDALRMQTDWAQSAIRLHGLLSQTLADEVIDEIIWEAEVGFNQAAFVGPLALAG